MVQLYHVFLGDYLNTLCTLDFVLTFAWQSLDLEYAVFCANVFTSYTLLFLLFG